MNDERLIQLVRQYPVLYDASHSKYMDYAGKQSKWDIIAYEMKVLNATECKQRWNYIRDSYRRSLRRTLTKGGYPKKHVYKYAKELEFLKKHLSEKNPKKIYETEITEQIDEQNESESMNDETNCERDSDFSHDSQEANNSTNKQMFEHIDLPVEDDEVPGLYEIEEPNLSQDTVSLQLLKYLTKNKDFKSATTEKHPVDLFLTFISRTLKSLDAYHLNLAKSEIFATAQKYEMQMILNQSSGQSTANQPNSPDHGRNSSPHSSCSKPFTLTPVILSGSIDPHNSENS